jgi:hypothetical protein
MYFWFSDVFLPLYEKNGIKNRFIKRLLFTTVCCGAILVLIQFRNNKQSINSSKICFWIREGYNITESGLQNWPRSQSLHGGVWREVLRRSIPYNRWTENQHSKKCSCEITAYIAGNCVFCCFNSEFTNKINKETSKTDKNAIIFVILLVLFVIL